MKPIIALLLWLCAASASAQINNSNTVIGATPARTPETASTTNFPQGLSGSTFSSIQSGSITIATNALSNTATITGVNLATSWISTLGFISNDANNTADRNVGRLELTNTTTVTCSRGGQASTGTLVCQFYVVQFASGPSVQHVTCAEAGTTCSAVISAIVVNRTVPVWLGETVQSGGPPGAVVGWQAALTFPDTTHVLFTTSPNTTATQGADIISF